MGFNFAFNLGIEGKFTEFRWEFFLYCFLFLFLCLFFCIRSVDGSAITAAASRVEVHLLPVLGSPGQGSIRGAFALRVSSFTSLCFYLFGTDSVNAGMFKCVVSSINNSTTKWF